MKITDLDRRQLIALAVQTKTLTYQQALSMNDAELLTALKDTPIVAEKA